jgi:NTE family protein
MRGVKDTSLWKVKRTTILDKVGLISGVSGGNILATYYAAFGDEAFTRFESEFLLSNFEKGLIQTVFSPRQMYISSARHGMAAVIF